MGSYSDLKFAISTGISSNITGRTGRRVPVPFPCIHISECFFFKRNIIDNDILYRKTCIIDGPGIRRISFIQLPAQIPPNLFAYSAAGK